jgi:hypothetical protein
MTSSIETNERQSDWCARVGCGGVGWVYCKSRRMSDEQSNSCRNGSVCAMNCSTSARGLVDPATSCNSQLSRGGATAAVACEAENSGGGGNGELV